MPLSTGEPKASLPMRSTKSAHIHCVLLAASVAGLVGLTGCTAATQDNFTNPPPGPPPSCTQVPALSGCTEGALSYSCTKDRPDDGDTNLVCDEGAPGVGFEGGVPTLYCCVPYGQWASECSPSTHVPGCGAESLGFSCSGQTSPDQVDTSLVCSQALQGDGGVKDYCCVSFNQSSGVCRCSSFDEDAGLCGATDTVAACSGGTIGFTCAGAHTPTEVNPLLACTSPDRGSDSAYCCQTP
jgi:hypothetical protein